MQIHDERNMLVGDSTYPGLGVATISHSRIPRIMIGRGGSVQTLPCAD